jgi:hypothetical protein
MPARTATGPNGEKVVLQNGAWLPLEQAAAPGALPGRPTAAAAEQDRATRTAMRTMFGDVLSNLIGLPHAAGELLALGAAGLDTAGGAALAAARGKPLDIANRFAAARARNETLQPAAALLALPEPTGEEVLAAGTAAAKAPGIVLEDLVANARHTFGGAPPATNPVRDVSQAYRDALAAEAARSAENPLATSAGRTAGDVATLMTLRPGDRVRRVLSMRRGTPTVAPEMRSAVEQAARVFGRGLGRAAESGFEGALMGALGDADPAKTAAWAAGMQAGGSMALTAKNSFLRNPFKTFAGLYLGHEMFKALAPGPQDFFESKDMAVNEMVAAYGLGAVAAIAGADRGIGTGKLRQITNALASASRGTVQSVITQLHEAAGRGETEYARVLELMSEDPDYFGREARMRLERASRSEQPNALLNEIDGLMQSRRFRRLLERSEEQEEK